MCGMTFQLMLLTSGHYSHLRKPLVQLTCPNTSVIHIRNLCLPISCVLYYYLNRLSCWAHSMGPQRSPLSRVVVVVVVVVDIDAQAACDSGGVRQ